MKKTKILTIANRKGGAGKSTCAAHLSLEAVKNGFKTILIDLDPQKTLEVSESKFFSQAELPNNIGFHHRDILEEFFKYPEKQPIK